MAGKALVIGLDGAPPQWVFDRWLDELPNLRALTKAGSYGVLRSCDPPITVPAWSVMTSSRSPGTLGCYGFRNRPGRGYACSTFADSRTVRVPRLWDVLSARGRPVVVLGVPQTYPPTPVQGVLVSCFMTPDTERCCYTYPAELVGEVERVVGPYVPDVTGFRTTDKARLLEDLQEVTDRRFLLAAHLLATRPWDLFFLVEMSTDRLNHGLWRFFDPEHRLYEPGSPYEPGALDFYRSLDARLGRLLRFADDETSVLVVSDHGAKRLDGGVCLNEWLRREGYLVLKREPAGPEPLTPDLVDWTRTIAWGAGGYYGRVFLNVAGREPEGAVAPGDHERLRGEVRERLGALPAVAYTPEELYAECNGTAPDLLVYFDDLHDRSLGQVGTDVVRVSENDTGPDDANHAHEGLYILVGNGVPAGPGPELDILDVAPTLLDLLGEPVPAEMEGSSLVAAPSARPF